MEVDSRRLTFGFIEYVDCGRSYADSGSDWLLPGDVIDLAPSCCDSVTLRPVILAASSVTAVWLIE